jgi:hypothetical protein
MSAAQTAAADSFVAQTIQALRTTISHRLSS